MVLGAAVWNQHRTATLGIVLAMQRGIMRRMTAIIVFVTLVPVVIAVDVAVGVAYPCYEGICL